LIEQKKVKPPFIPKISSDTDTRYIDTEFTSETAKDSPWEGSLGGTPNVYESKL